jgi:hypothetical protein
MTLGGKEHEIELDGVEPLRPPTPDSLRAAGPHRGDRAAAPCTIVRELERGRLRARVRVRCFAWHDKSGDVWVDLSELLVDEGVARPSRTAEAGAYAFCTSQSVRNPHRQLVAFGPPAASTTIASGA